jgi:hypothetical protein
VTVPTPAAVPAPPRLRLAPIVILVGIGMAILTGWHFLHARSTNMLNVTFGNQAVTRIAESGFHNQETDNEGLFRWTDGQAKMVIPLGANDRPHALYMRFRRPNKVAVRILVNGQELFNEPPTGLPLSTLERTFDLNRIDIGKEIAIEILSNTVVPKMDSPNTDDGREIGVQVRDIRLLSESVPLLPPPTSSAAPPAPTTILGRLIGLEPIPGILEEGLGRLETSKGLGDFRFTNGAAKLTVPIASEWPKAMHVALGVTVPHEMRIGIKVNGQSIFDESLAMPWSWARTFDLSAIPPAKELVIELLSGAWVPSQLVPGSTDNRALGVCLRGITLLSGKRSFVNVPLGVREVPGVEESGFYWPENTAANPCRWTNGTAKLTVPLAGQKPRALALTAMLPDKPFVHVRITICGQPLFEGDVRPVRQWSVQLPLNEIKLVDPAVIEIVTPTVVPAADKPGNQDKRRLGIRIFRLMLVGDAAAPQ